MNEESIKPIMSEKINEITKAMVEAQKAINPIDKTGQVDYTFNGKRTRYDYAKYADMWKMAHDAICDNGLVFWNVPVGEKVYGIMTHTSGQYIGGYLDIKATKNKYNNYDPQDVGTWVTYLSKYLFKASLNLPTDDDDATGLRGGAAKEDAQAPPKEPCEEKPVKEPKAGDIFETLANSTGMTIDDIKAKLKKVGINKVKQITDMGREAIIKILNGKNNGSQQADLYGGPDE